MVTTRDAVTVGRKSQGSRTAAWPCGHVRHHWEGRDQQGWRQMGRPRRQGGRCRALGEAQTRKPGPKLNRKCQERTAKPGVGTEPFSAGRPLIRGASLAPHCAHCSPPLGTPPNQPNRKEARALSPSNTLRGRRTEATVLRRARGRVLYASTSSLLSPLTRWSGTCPWVGTAWWTPAPRAP